MAANSKLNKYLFPIVFKVTLLNFVKTKCLAPKKHSAIAICVLFQRHRVLFLTFKFVEINNYQSIFKLNSINQTTSINNVFAHSYYTYALFDKRSVWNSIDAFKPSIKGETATVPRETRQSYPTECQCSAKCRKTGQKILGNAEIGGLTPPAVRSRFCSFQYFGS